MNSRGGDESRGVPRVHKPGEGKLEDVTGGHKLSLISPTHFPDIYILYLYIYKQHTQVSNTPFNVTLGFQPQAAVIPWTAADVCAGDDAGCFLLS